jgi:hypothetical protein
VWVWGLAGIAYLPLMKLLAPASASRFGSSFTTSKATINNRTTIPDPDIRLQLQIPSNLYNKSLCFLEMILA